MQITEPGVYTRDSNVKYNSQHLRYGPKNTQTRARGNITYCIKQQRQTATEIMKRNVQHASVCVWIRLCVDANPCCVSPLRFTKRERDVELCTHARESVESFFPQRNLYIPDPLSIRDRSRVSGARVIAGARAHDSLHRATFAAKTPDLGV